MGRAAAIAYAREGADVAINFFPTEQPDADEVVALIKEAGRKAVALPGDLRDEEFCKKLVGDAVRELRVVNGGRSRLRGLSLTGGRAALSLRRVGGARAGGGACEVRADERRRGQQA